MSKRRVRFQTSIEESDESEARRIFLQFERGQSGHLDLKQFKQAVAELDVTNKDKVQTLFKKIDVDGNGSGKVSSQSHVIAKLKYRNIKN